MNLIKEILIKGSISQGLSYVLIWKKTSLEKVYDALCGKVEEVILDEDISKKALVSLENMHKLGEMVVCGN